MLWPALCMPGKSLPTSHLRESSLEIPRRSWSHIAVAFVTGLPPSEGDQVILTVVEWVFKAAHFIPLPKFLSEAETGELLVQHVVRFHRIPRDIVSDRGSVLLSSVEGLLLGTGSFS